MKTKSMVKAGSGLVDIEPKDMRTKKEHEDMMDKHETNKHLDTISDAMDIMRDPVKMKKMHAMVGRKKKAITSLKQLKDISNARALGKDDMDEM